MDDGIRIACYADLHGILPDPVECDLAIVAGDVCPEASIHQQFAFIHGKFYPWLEKFPRVAWIAGNHDYVCQEVPHLIGEYSQLSKRFYLYNDAVKHLFHPMNTRNHQWKETRISGLRIWGTPYSLPYGNYAFMVEEDFLSDTLRGLDIDKPHILISHGPPYGHGDIGFRNERAGSHALLDAIRKHQPWLVVYGHIHEGRGIYEEGSSVLVNAAMAGQKVGIGLEYPPIIVDLDSEGKIQGINL